MMLRGGGMPVRALATLLAMGMLLGACSAEPDPTPYPTPAPRPAADEAAAAASAFLGAWRRADYEAMHRMLAAPDRARYDLATFSDLLATFDELAGAHGLGWTAGEAYQTAIAPEPRSADEPPPTPTPIPTGASADPTPTSSPSVPSTPSPTPAPPDTPLDGPIPAIGIPVVLQFETDNFGVVDLDRELLLTAGPESWQVRWSPGILFPELGDGGQLELAREVPVRGRIVSTDGTVWAETLEDGRRVYPQEWMAGQTIGYATPGTEADLRKRPRPGMRVGDLVGRIGLEFGADALLRGTPGFTLTAVPATGDPVQLLQRAAEPGADLVITLRRGLQASADAQIANQNEAGTAVIDPDSGDVWALASAPRFNPNAMTIGTTLAGVPLAAPSLSARINHATLGAYPAGSSFKIWTLAAALEEGVATPATRMSCNGTWTFSGFTFRNYEEHTLGGLVDLLQAMAFSCNTTYMPLSILVYDHDRTALTDLVREFGFGQYSGMRYLVEEDGILPDAAYFEETPRWDGAIRPYGPFDQIQLAIGQGSYLGTPLQLANAYAAVGNGGTLWIPRIVVEARLPDGTVVESVEPEARREVSASDATLDYVVESMKAVVSYSYGTANPAFRGFGVQVAGKSGTAETGGPDPDAWFPAIAPADDPEIAIATVLVRVPLATGGADAAPLVRRVLAQYFAER
jgi:penicillin-binding protein 2